MPLKLSANRAEHTENPLHLDRDSADSPFFEVFRTDDYYKSLSGVSIRRCVEIDEPARTRPPSTSVGGKEGSRVILRYSNGRPAILTRKVGAGDVLLVTTSADLSWNDWPLVKGMYVPFLDMSLNHLLHAQTQNHNLSAGEPVRWIAPEKLAGQAFALMRPDGKIERLGPPETFEGRPVVTTSSTNRAGIYRLVHADQLKTKAGEPSISRAERSLEGEGRGVPFAVVPDARETENLDSLTDQQMDERLGFKAVHLTAGEDVNVFSGVERLNREWTLWILLAALAVAMGETALAWLCGRPW